MKYTDKELKLLSSGKALFYLMKDEAPDFKATLSRLQYEMLIEELQIKLLQVQQWVVKNQKRLIIIFEGVEFAGKGGAINVISEHLNPRSLRIVALPKPSESEKGNWYFQRYIKHLPSPGEIVLFDRSWYNRGMVEPVNGFCTEAEYKQFMKEVLLFEQMLHNDGIVIIKIYLSINKKVQAERIEIVRNNPLRKWELTPVDEKAQSLWDKYKEYEQVMFKKTGTKNNPWIIIDANDRKKSHVKAIEAILSNMPSKYKKA